MASWAFFNLAADTNFIALVICLVEFTDTILFLTSFKLAMACIFYVGRLYRAIRLGIAETTIPAAIPFY
jgi:hypothetical protein